MSGPKGYSVSVFDSDLSKIFQIQSSVQTMIEGLCKCQVCDKDRNIEFDCNGYVQSTKNDVAQLLSPFTINHTGTISQRLYDDYRRKLQQKLTQLESFLSTLQKEKADFKEKQDDYNAFVSFDSYFEHATDNFQSFKSQVVQYLSTYIQKEYPQLFTETKTSVESVNIKIERVGFSFGFRNIKSEKQFEIRNEIQRCETGINDIRNQTSDKVISDITKNNLAGKSVSDAVKLKENDKTSQNINDRIETIKVYISELYDPKRQKQYQAQLEKLTQSHTFKDEFFFIELFEDIKNAEKIHKWKTEIHQEIVKLNELKIHEKFQPEKSELLQSAILLVEKNRPKPYELEDFLTRLKLFKEKNNMAIQEKLSKEKERQFIKTQLIHSLENLNYEVMNNMQVIDFEKESDFLLNIPNQSNYLNLRFNSDGSFVYNFLIPEKRAALSIDQKKQKIGEMESTCTEFKTLLKELTAMGLKTDLNKEIPISEKALIQVPKKHRAIVQKRIEKTIDAVSEKVRYLDK